jgi:multidrug transporter EmrE-like cation transporter
VIFGRWDDVKKVFYDKRDLKLIFYASFIITLNWGLYIWAVNSNHILQTSMGYYINPLSSVLLGMIVFKEKLNVLQKAAIALAVAGVSILIFQYGRIPWVALGLAGTFSIYGVIKKLVKMDPMVGIVFEAGFTTPFAIMYLLYKQNNGLGIFGNVSTSIFLLVMASGIITALPLILLADVVVCDGFTGNIFIKTVEGLGSFIFDQMKKQIKKKLLYILCARAIAPAVKAAKANIDYSEYGGAMFLGLDGVLIKCHGSSDRKAIANGIKVANNFAHANISDKLKQCIETVSGEENSI